MFYPEAKRVSDVATAKYTEAIDKYDKALRKYENALRKHEADANNLNPPVAPQAPPAEAPPSSPRLNLDEPDIFLTLSAALHLILARSLSEDDVEKGETYLFEYLEHFKKVR
jgi:hypothetical protein